MRPESVKLGTLIYYHVISDADEFPLSFFSIVKCLLATNTEAYALKENV